MKFLFVFLVVAAVFAEDPCGDPPYRLGDGTTIYFKFSAFGKPCTVGESIFTSNSTNCKCPESQSARPCFADLFDTYFAPNNSYPIVTERSTLYQSLNQPCTPGALVITSTCYNCTCPVSGKTIDCDFVQICDEC